MNTPLKQTLQWGISMRGLSAKFGSFATAWALGLALLLGTSSALAQSSPANKLVNIEVVPLTGQQIQLRLETSGLAPTPLSFTIENPARISLDLPDTGLALTSRRKDVDLGALRSVLSAEANGRTRVVLNLDSMVPYTTEVQGNNIYITLGSNSGSSAASSNPFTVSGGGVPSSTPPVSTSGGYKAIENIDFRRSDDGAGRVIVTLADPSTVVDIQEQGGNVIVDFIDTALPGGLQRRYDVLDFATPVATVDASQSGNNARVIIGSNGPYEQVAYQSDNLFTVELRAYEPTAEEQLREIQDKEYSGERLTLNFQDIETRAVLQLLADVSGQNIVVSDTVQGNVTLRLQSVPWDQALDIVLQTKGLGMRQNDNVIIVAPAEEIAARERQELESLQKFEELAPLRSEFVQVNYAKATDLASLVGSGENTILSDRGSINIDERTNTLLVQDTAEKLSEIRRLVQRLDVPVRQVLIETRIVVVNDDYNRQLGVRMGFSDISRNSSDGLISISGSATGNDITNASALENLQDTGNVFPVSIGSLADRLAVNLPVANPAGRLALSILDSDYLVDLELSALQAEGRGEIISTPRVITANQKEARIEQGVEIPFQESSSSGATTTQFKKAVLSLTVTPLITPDDRIIMDLIVSQDSVGESVPSATGGFVPSIDTREVETQVLVSNGETVVLGGIYETEEREINSKVPVLGDLPVLGAMFRTTQKVSNKSELLIFVTPRIIKEGANLN